MGPTFRASVVLKHSSSSIKSPKNLKWAHKYAKSPLSVLSHRLVWAFLITILLSFAKLLMLLQSLYSGKVFVIFDCVQPSSSAGHNILNKLRLGQNMETGIFRLRKSNIGTKIEIGIYKHNKGATTMYLRSIICVCILNRPDKNVGKKYANMQVPVSSCETITPLGAQNQNWFAGKLV